MNAKRCKLLRKIALLTEQQPKETLYFKNKNTGTIRVGKCTRVNYLVMKRSEKKKNTRRSYLKLVVRELVFEQQTHSLKALEEKNV